MGHKEGGLNPIRGAKVIAYAREVLDQACPLHSASHADAEAYLIEQGELRVRMADGVTELRDPTQFKGYMGPAKAPDGILLCNNNLHLKSKSIPHPRLVVRTQQGSKISFLRRQ